MVAYAPHADVFDLDQVIHERRSIRMFLPDEPVPRELIDEALELAVRAPSNSNNLHIGRNPIEKNVVFLDT